MSKAIAIHSLVLIIMMAMFLLTAIGIFKGWLPGFENITQKISCGMKRTSYCAEWLKTRERPEQDWSEYAPGCEAYEPKELEDCKP
jgi:hypothetical protein